MTEESTLRVEIITPQRVVHSGNALSVTVPGSKSPFQVLPRHAPIVSALDPGLVKIDNSTEEPKYFATSTGFTEVLDNKISILVERAENASEVDIEETERELQKAQDKLSNAISKKDIENLRERVARLKLLLKAVQSRKS